MDVICENCSNIDDNTTKHFFDKYKNLKNLPNVIIFFQGKKTQNKTFEFKNKNSSSVPMSH